MHETIELINPMTKIEKNHWLVWKIEIFNSQQWHLSTKNLDIISSIKINPDEKRRIRSPIQPKIKFSMNNYQQFQTFVKPLSVSPTLQIPKFKFQFRSNTNTPLIPTLKLQNIRNKYSYNILSPQQTLEKIETKISPNRTFSTHWTT